MEQRDDVFAASSSAQTSRTVDIVAVKEECFGTFEADCIKAYYQAVQTQNVVVKPPAEYLALLAHAGKSTDIMWKLERMLPGQRDAGAEWVSTAARKFVSKEYERCPGLPQFFFRRSDRVLIEVHMDDFHGTGPIANVPAALAELRILFDLKATDVITTGRYAHLKRERLKRPDGSTLLRPDVKYIDGMVEIMGMQKAKPADTPDLAEEPPENSPQLDVEEAGKYRSSVGLALYVTPDREDIQRAVQYLTRKLKEPTEYDRRALVRLVRYLKGTRTYGIELRKTVHKPLAIKLDAYSDTDFATCKETRRAMTCGKLRIDGMPYSGFARRQGVQSTSSAEAEFYGCSSVVM